jgi:hypothetical protein
MDTTQLPSNFRWLEEGRVAGSGLPEGPEQIDALHAAGVRAVVSFHPLPEPALSRLLALGIEHLPYPVSGFTTAPETALSALLEFVDARSYPTAGPPCPVLFH